MGADGAAAELKGKIDSDFLGNSKKKKLKRNLNLGIFIIFRKRVRYTEGGPLKPPEVP